MSSKNSPSPGKMQTPRGTHDLLPDEQAKHSFIVKTAADVAARFGFQGMSTPIFEFTEVFSRTLGDASDIVTKEMYTFEDRNGEKITLRPEGTAGIARAFIEHGLTQSLPLKFFYHGPMFRYERPQKGRQRQFHQLGVELLGVATPFADLECLTLGFEIIKALGIAESSRLELNSLGDRESRTRYNESLVRYLTQHQSQLSPDSQTRLNENPLRILDSKEPRDLEILNNAPVLAEFYNETSKSFFDTITQSLRALNIPFEVNPRLVRGLDYYTHCVFEFKTSNLGAQDAILSGGRYDQLIETMGGPPTAGVGFAAGIERLAMLAALSLPSARPVTVIPVHESVEVQAYELCYRLRSTGLRCEIGFSGNLSKRMKRASRDNAYATIVLGPDELARGEVVVKMMDSGEQRTIKITELEDVLLRARDR